MENKHTFGFSPCSVKAADEAEKKKGRKKDKAAVAPAQPETDNTAVQETGDILAQ